MTDQKFLEASAQSADPTQPVTESPRNNLTGKIVRIVIAVAIALLSLSVIAETAASPDTYAGTIEILDEKKGNVLALAAASAGASVGISLLPDNIGDPIATELADLSSDFTIVVGAILLEKYLLTILGLAAFRLLIPLACLFYVLGVLRPNFEAAAKRYAIKVALLAVILIAVVPASTALSSSIDDTFAASAEVAALAAAGETEESPETEAVEETKFNLIDFITDGPSSAVEAVTDATEATISKATNALNRLMEAFAIMIITSCVIPILVLAFGLWLINLLLGVDVSAPMTGLKSRSWRKPAATKRKDLAGKAVDIQADQGAEIQK